MAERRSQALISVFNKDGIDTLAKKLVEAGFEILSTGGTASFLAEKGIAVNEVENLTDYPSILGGRVKTLHPKVFGGILARLENESDQKDVAAYDISPIDVVVVDLYPFEETVKQQLSHEEIIEKIDIGGISLLRAAAKNYQRTWVISSMTQYQEAISILDQGKPNEEVRKTFSAAAFKTCFEYDTAIHQYLSGEIQESIVLDSKVALRYGENPHQKGNFYGKLDEVFEQLHGKALSYNNLLDCDAALKLVSEFNETTVAVIKHNNACGLACRENLLDAWTEALAGDPISAFGGIIAINRKVDKETAEAIHQIFFEVIMAPDYSEEALEILQGKKNRIILKTKDLQFNQTQYRSLLNGIIAQDPDNITDSPSIDQKATTLAPSEAELEDLAFASKVCKHTKSNTIVLAKNKQLLASGTGQTSRVDALKQAIKKAEIFNFDLNGAVMASDAFFPFPDCVEIAGDEGIKAVIQPGGSIKDQASIDYCNAHNMSMVFTGTRHFKH